MKTSLCPSVFCSKGAQCMWKCRYLGENYWIDIFEEGNVIRMLGLNPHASELCWVLLQFSCRGEDGCLKRRCSLHGTIYYIIWDNLYMWHLSVQLHLFAWHSNVEHIVPVSYVWARYFVWNFKGTTKALPCISYSSIDTCAFQSHIRFNSLRPSDAYMRRYPNHHWFKLWLVAWTAPSHYLNQCWNIVNWTLGKNYSEF